MRNGFLEEVRLIKQLGFDGKSVIQPNQIKLVHRIYTPRWRISGKLYG
jgi:citrate lyase subunit beta/citryl-CoA lyase